MNNVGKGISPGASLVAHLVLSKYEHHLSLYDLQGQLANLGVDFPRQDLCNWIEKATWRLQPIVGHLKKELLAGDYLQVDETPVKVLDPEIKGRAAIGWLEGGARSGHQAWPDRAQIVKKNPKSRHQFIADKVQRQMRSACRIRFIPGIYNYCDHW